ncbi:hypothetical protein VPH35_063317 [Triticum aestivum]|uniref:Uncharacterized protein n=1 Tax=Aegilops tauschii TaxID=37682 RepID=M8C978_AEGTA
MPRGSPAVPALRSSGAIRCGGVKHQAPVRMATSVTAATASAPYPQCSWATQRRGPRPLLEDRRRLTRPCTWRHATEREDMHASAREKAYGTFSVDNGHPRHEHGRWYLRHQQRSTSDIPKHLVDLCMQSIAKGKSGQKSHGNQCEAYFTEHRDDFPMVESFLNVPQNVGNQEHA